MKVECCRCRNKHEESDRLQVPNTTIWKDVVAYDSVFPRCKGRSYYKLDENGKRV